MILPREKLGVQPDSLCHIAAVPMSNTTRSRVAVATDRLLGTPRSRPSPSVPVLLCAHRSLYTNTVVHCHGVFCHLISKYPPIPANNEKLTGAVTITRASND